MACLARWPGRIPSGLVDDRLTLTFDLTASIMAAAGARSRKDRPLDGIDVLGDIAAGRPAKPRTLYWRARRADRTWRAVRDGNLKYVSLQDADSFSEQLYDVSKDPGETEDLKERNKTSFLRLQRMHKEWEREMLESRVQ